MNAGPDTTDIAAHAVGIGAADEPKGQAMTNPDELERLARAAIAVHGAEWVEFFNEWEETSGAFGRAANPATILDLLAANRKMREAIERLMDAEFAKDWRTWSDERARLLLGVGPRFDAFMEARSALSTKETT
jgi:hypothetical protein